MLNAERLAFRYGSGAPWIVRDVTLAVAPAEVVGLQGPSGRGKTTLAKLLAGYLRPHAGQISVDGQPLPAHGPCPVQLVFQHPELAVNPRWRIARILAEGHAPEQEVIDGLGIERGWLRRWPHELSGGELQRVAVARALGPATRYLIADEMTAMLDANTQAQIWQVVLAHAQRSGVGVLVISHAGSLLKRLCERVISMDEALPVPTGEGNG